MLIMLLPPTLTPRSNATNTFIRFQLLGFGFAFCPSSLYHLPRSETKTSQTLSSQFGSVHPRSKALTNDNRRAIQSARFPWISRLLSGGRSQTTTSNLSHWRSYEENACG